MRIEIEHTGEQTHLSVAHVIRDGHIIADVAEPADRRHSRAGTWDEEAFRAAARAQLVRDGIVEPGDVIQWDPGRDQCQEESCNPVPREAAHRDGL